MSIVFATPKTAAEIISESADRTDEQLVLQYRETGDEGLFSELVHRYERELYSYFRRYLGNSEMAEDAFQATFLQLHLKCDQFQDAGCVLGFT